jgi:hypothetical protein
MDEIMGPKVWTSGPSFFSTQGRGRGSHPSRHSPTVMGGERSGSWWEGVIGIGIGIGIGGGAGEGPEEGQ